MEVTKVTEWAWVKSDKLALEELEVLLPDYLGIKVKQLVIYTKKDGLWGVPRYFVSPPYKEVSGYWPKIDFKDEINLLDYQEKVIQDYIEGLKTNIYGGLIVMPPGTGKTIVGLKLASILKLKTMIVVPTEMIFEQWTERIKKYFNLEPGIIKGPETKIKEITVAMIQTLIKGKHKALKENFGHIIFDEVHLIGAEVFSTVVPMFNPKIRTGLTATPRRADGAENVFRFHIGNPLATYNKPNLMPKIYKLEYTDPATIATKDCYFGDKFLKQKYLAKLNIPRRNKLITDTATKAIKAGYKVMILSDRLDLLEEYSKNLSDFGWVTGPMKNPDGKPILLATYGAAGIGFDAPDISCLILATPRTDIEQAVGRVLRKTDHKRTPIVVDIVDKMCPIMEGYYKKRYKNYYKDYKVEIRRA